MGNWYSFVTEYDIVIKLFYNNGGKLIMYNNVGEKLKSIATAIALVLMLFSLMITFALLGSGGGFVSIVVFLVLILLSWLSGIVLYGFGHLIVTQDSILKEQKAIANELRKMRSSENKDVDENYVVKDIELPKL